MAWRVSWVLQETWAGVRTRKLRALIVVATAAAAVGLLSFTSIASGLSSQRVVEQFDAVTGNRVVVTRVTATDQLPAHATIGRIENDALIDRQDEPVLESLPFVGAAGVYSTLESVELSGTGLDPRAIQVGAVSPRGFALVARPLVGVGISEAMDQARVAVVSSDVVEHLDSPYRWAESYIYLDGRPYAVVGVADVDPPGGESWDVLIPHRKRFGVKGVMASISGVPGPEELEAIAIATASQDPTEVSVDVPLSPYALRRRVLGEIATTTRRLGVAVLAAAVASMAAIGFVTVLERRWEIGLRRALGADGLDITIQFIGEAVVLGLVGGLIGVLGGSAVLVALVETPVAALAEPLANALALGGLIGAAAGLVSGALPTVLAVRTEPVDALRTR